MGMERVQQIAIAEQLGAEASCDTNPPNDQTVEDQQAQAEAHVAHLIGRGPGPGREVDRPRHAIPDCLVQAPAGQPVAQVGVVREDPDDVVRHRLGAGALSHGELIPLSLPGRGRGSLIRRPRRACASAPR